MTHNPLKPRATAPTLNQQSPSSLSSLTSNPILIAKSPTHQKKEKKETRVAHSAPNPFRPPPPKAPQQRPRVPSCDPPAMELPPSPLVEPPLLTGLAIKEVPQKKPKEKENNNKKISAMSRSLTNNPPTFLSSSAPPVSYVNFGNKDLFAPSVGTITEKGKVEEKKETTPKSSSPRNNKKESHPLPEELLATVGSPTIFSMLRSDSDVRRKSSVTSNNSLPGTGGSGGNSGVPVEDVKKEERDDEEDEIAGRGVIGNREIQFQFEDQLDDEEGPPQHNAPPPNSVSSANQKDDFFAF